MHRSTGAEISESAQSYRCNRSDWSSFSKRYWGQLLRGKKGLRILANHCSGP
jgi:hypothetical protein